MLFKVNFRITGIIESETLPTTLYASFNLALQRSTLLKGHVKSLQLLKQNDFFYLFVTPTYFKNNNISFSKRYSCYLISSMDYFSLKISSSAENLRLHKLVFCKIKSRKFKYLYVNGIKYWEGHFGE